MTMKALFRLLMVVAVACLGSTGVAQAQGKGGEKETLIGSVLTRGWDSEEMNAREVRRMIYRSTVAGRHQEKIILGSAYMTDDGINLAGNRCGMGIKWRAYVEHKGGVIGGFLCNGKASKERKKFGKERFRQLLDHVAGSVLWDLGIKTHQAGRAQFARSDGRDARIRFAKGGGVRHPIMSIVFSGDEVKINRY